MNDDKLSLGEAPLPALRQALEAIQIENDGQPMVLLRDQEEITQQAMALSLPGFLIATALNGHNKISDVQSLFAKTTGSVVSPGEIQGLVNHLEKADLLETEQVREKRIRAWKEFGESPVRKAHHVGRGYPKDSLELAATLGKFFKDPKGPGLEVPSTPTQKLPPVGLVSPHIDFARGGPAYAWAYQALAQSPPPDVIVALGVAHMSPNSPWVMSNKSFETPYGELGASQDLFEELKKTLWYDSRAYE